MAYRTTCPKCESTSPVQGVHANGQRIWRCPCRHEWSVNPAYPLPTPTDSSPSEPDSTSGASGRGKLPDGYWEADERARQQVEQAWLRQYGNKPFAKDGCLYWLSIAVGGVAGWFIPFLIGWMFGNPGVGVILATCLGVWIGFGVAYHLVDGDWSTRDRGPRY